MMRLSEVRTNSGHTMAHFGIQAVEEIEPWKIVGWNHQGTLRVGARFTSIEDTDGTIHPVDLQITRIENYNRVWEELDEGLSARLYLIGTGGERMRQKCILRSA